MKNYTKPEIKKLLLLLVDSFMAINYLWFHDKTNSLHGLEKEAKKMLIDYVTKEKFPKDDYRYIYILDKFKEWTGI